MTTFTLLGYFLLLAEGVVIGIMFGPTIQKWYMGAEAFAAHLRTTADATLAAIKKV